MRTLSYVCAATGESIGFEGPLYGETLAGLRGRVWDYSLASRGMSGVARKTREATATVKIHDSPDTLDLLRRLADADMASGEPGTLVADGEWEAHAWIAKSEPQTVTPTMVETQLTFVLVDGVWRRESLNVFHMQTSEDSQWLDLPCDLPCDLGGMAAIRTVRNPTPIRQPARITIYGPCTNPYIVIGTNRYQVDASVPEGGRIEIDGASAVKTVVMVDAQGNRSNLFGKARRGAGPDGGEYIFQPLEPGIQQIAWRNDFDFDVTVVEERTEPPWT